VVARSQFFAQNLLRNFLPRGIFRPGDPKFAKNIVPKLRKFLGKLGIKLVSNFPFDSHFSRGSCSTRFSSPRFRAKKQHFFVRKKVVRLRRGGEVSHFDNNFDKLVRENYADNFRIHRRRGFRATRKFVRG